MLKIGLTGGIGCGKSSVTAVLKENGVSIVDADQIARDLLQTDTPAFKAVVQCFGGAILNTEGALNRKVLAKIVFSDPQKLEQLEAILHPKVYDEIESQLDNTMSNASYIVVDIPLLIEKGYLDLFDKLVVVDCLPEQQIQRVQQRDKTEKKIIQSIMAQQIERKKRLEKADFILDNSDSKKALQSQINSLHRHLIHLS